MGRKKRRGHWCWCCDSILPNERFSGKNHRRHLCRDCARKPKEERDYLAIARDMDRLWLRGGKRNQRRIRAFLEHADARVRVYAADLLNPPQVYFEELEGWEYDPWEGLEPDPEAPPDSWWSGIDALAPFPILTEPEPEDLWDELPTLEPQTPQFGHGSPAEPVPFDVVRQLILAIAAWAVRLRVERGWSQQELADRAQVTLTTLQRFEHAREISISRAVRIAMALDPEALSRGLQGWAPLSDTAQ